MPAFKTYQQFHRPLLTSPYASCFSVQAEWICQRFRSRNVVWAAVLMGSHVPIGCGPHITPYLRCLRISLASAFRRISFPGSWRSALPPPHPKLGRVSREGVLGWSRRELSCRSGNDQHFRRTERYPVLHQSGPEI